MHDRIIHNERSRARVVIEVYKPAPLLIAPDINPHTQIYASTHCVLVLSCCKLMSYLHFHLESNVLPIDSLLVDFHLLIVFFQFTKQEITVVLVFVSLY